MSTKLSDLRREFHRNVCKRLLVVDNGIASNADKDGRTSVALALSIATQLSAPTAKKLAGQTAGQEFEKHVAEFIESAFGYLGKMMPGYSSTECVNSRSDLIIARYAQYSHLNEVKRIADRNPDLAVFVGNDYSVASDVIVSRRPIDDQAFQDVGLTLDGDLARQSPIRASNSRLPLMHASVSCKWTMRSDRAQNSRFEALSLIRSRKGRVPHIVVVTGEPLPSRLASLALGTGDIDCVYHFALPELQRAVAEVNQEEAQNLLRLMVEGNRLRDISDLPIDLLA